MKILRRLIGKFFHIFYKSSSNFFSVQGKVLMLHWIGDEKQDEETELYRITIRQCKNLLSWLSRKNTIRLENWESEDNFYAVTIDDVPSSFYKNAYPLFKEAGIPFTLFINVSLLDKEGYITQKQLLEMSQCELCTIGSHGITHGEFALLNSEQALNELKNSKYFLEQIVGKSVELFAYPYGSYYACGYSNKHLAGFVYKYAFGTVACPITKPSLMRKYFLPRINVDMKKKKKMS